MNHTPATKGFTGYLERYYPESRFGGFSMIDGTVAFYTRVNGLIRPSDVVVDFGCGRGSSSEDPVALRRDLQVLKGKCARVMGIDFDPIGRENKKLDELRLIESPNTPWPLPDASVDMCLADSVLEHIEDPDRFFYECRRVIKPGGHICIRTPNVNSYVGLATRLIPNRLHTRVLSKVQPDRKEEDIFPTFMACNTPRQVRRMLSKYGFDSFVCSHDAEPSYLAFSRLSFILGVVIRHITPPAFRVAIFGFGRKL